MAASAARVPGTEWNRLVLGAAEAGNERSMSALLGLAMLRPTDKDPFAQGLRQLEAQLRIADLFGRERKKLVSLSRNRPAFLRDAPEVVARQHLPVRRVARKSEQYSTQVQDHAQRFTRRYDRRLGDMIDRPMQAKATLAVLFEGDDTSMAVYTAIASEEFVSYEQLRNFSGRTVEAVTDLLGDISEDVTHLPEALRNPGIKTEAYRLCAESIDGGFLVASDYLDEAVIEMTPGAIDL